MEKSPDLSSGYVLGIDVGGSFTKVRAFTTQGKHVASHAFESPKIFDDRTHALLATCMVPLLEQMGSPAGAVRAIGLALPGAVTAEDELEFCPNLSLDMSSYKAFLQACFPQAHVVALNDADAAVLGDRWCGSSADQNSKNVVLITLGTGVGAGILVEGELYRGAHGAAGEVGHLRVNFHETRFCNCGNRGCLEQYASASALVRNARTLFLARDAARDDKGGESGGASGTACVEGASASEGAPAKVEELSNQAALQAYPDARCVLEAAPRGDRVAAAAVEQFADALGFGLAQIACFFDPDLLVLGGGLSEGAPLFLEAVRERYQAHALSVCREIPVMASTLGNRCGAYGAAYHALKTIEANVG